MTDLNLAVKLSLKNDAFIAQMRASEAEARKFGQQVSKSLSGTDAGWAKLSAQGRQAEASLASMQKSQAKWAALSAQGMEQVSAKTVKLTADTKDAEKSLAGLAAAASLAVKAAAGLYVVGALKGMASDAFQAKLAFDSQQKALSNVVGGMAQARAEYAVLEDVADRLGVSVQALSQSYLGFANAVKGSSLEGEAGRRVFAGLVSTMTDVGATSEQTAAVIFQVAQGINKEKVQLEDLNIIAERGVPIFRMLADAYGVTRSELFDMIGKGLIPADEAYRKVFGTVDNGTRRVESLSAGLSRLSSEWDKLLRSFANSAPIESVINLLGRLLREINDVTDTTTALSVPTVGGSTDQLEAKRAAIQTQLGSDGAGFGLAPGVRSRLKQQLREIEQELSPTSGIVPGASPASLALANQEEQVRAQLDRLEKSDAGSGDNAQRLREKLLRIEMERETLRTSSTRATSEEQRLFEQMTAAQAKVTAPVKPQKIEYDRTRAAAIADYLESRGLTPIQVAGIVGNLAQESGFGTGLSGGDGGSAAGVAQWRLDRKDALLNFAQRSGTPPTDLKTQLDFLVAEARQRGDLDALRQARSPEQAAKIFADRFERPKPETANYEYRAAVAAEVYDRSALDRLRVSGRSTRTTDRITTEDETRLTEELTRIESERTEKIVQQRDEIRRRTVETYDQMLDDLKQSSEEETRIITEQKTYQSTLEARTEAEFERRQTAQRTFLDEAYQAKLISAHDYYAKLQALADEDLNRKLAAIDKELAAETDKQAKLQALIDAQRARNLPTIDAEAELIRSSTRRIELETQRDTANATYRTTSQKLTVDATAAQAESTGDTNALQEFVTQYNDGLGSMQQYTFTAVSGMQNALSDFFETGMQGTESLGASFAKMARKIAADIAAMMITKGIVSFLGMIAGGASGGVLTAADATAVGAMGTPGAVFPGAGLPGGAAGGMVAPGLIGNSGTGIRLFDLTPRTDVSQFAAGGLVPVRVSAGEGYVPPTVVQSVGVPKLERLNELSRIAVSPLQTNAAFGVASPAIPGLSVFYGPGTGTSDSINTMLPASSFVLREAAIRADSSTELLTISLPADAMALRPIMQAPEFVNVGLPLNPASAPGADAAVPVGSIPGLQRFVGPGTGTSDSIPALLPEGSFVLREAAMQALARQSSSAIQKPRFADGGMVPSLVSTGEGYVPPATVQSVGVRALDRINALGAGLPRYASGGFVGSLPDTAGSSSFGLSIDMPLTLNVDGTGQGRDGTGFSRDRAAMVQRELKNAVQSAVMDMKRPGGPLWSGRG